MKVTQLRKDFSGLVRMLTEIGPERASDAQAEVAQFLLKHLDRMMTLDLVPVFTMKKALSMAEPFYNPRKERAILRNKQGRDVFKQLGIDHLWEDIPEEDMED